MAETNEPRALTSALASPAFVTRNSGMAMHAANRHVERWAPEAGADRVRSLRNLGFVDRLVAPWLETAQRSSTLRMFSTAHRNGPAEREGGAVSWVFPRPWYQDELDWMAAARQVPAQTEPQSAPTMLTTRGTFVAPRSVATTVMPQALYEYVAPSLSIAQPQAHQPQGVGFAGATRADAFSPLVSFASVQAAQMIARIAPSVAQATRAPQLRNVLATILDRATVASEPMVTRLAQNAPELVTPPAPRADDVVAPVADATPTVETPAMQVAQRMVEQRQQIVELQRVAQQSAARELATRQAQAQAASAQPDVNREAARAAAVRSEQLRAEAAVAQVRGEAARSDAARVEIARAEAARSEAARIEDRVAQRVAERRLHDQARVEAAQHARAPEAIAPVATPSTSSPGTPTQLAAPTTAAPSAISAALAALSPQLASYIGSRPDRAVQAIAELDTAMRAVELLARGAASPQQFEATRGPRMMLPAGLGGLVATLDHSAAAPRQAQAMSTAQLDAAPSMAPSSPASGMSTASVRRELRLPTLASFEAPAMTTAPARPMLRPTVADMRAPRAEWTPAAAQQAAAPRSAFAATMQSAPTALTHVAWADRWLARFAGAQPRSLDTFAAASTGGFQALVDSAPGAVFVAPVFDVDRAPVMTALAQQSAPMTTTATATSAAPTMATSASLPSRTAAAQNLGVGTRDVSPTLIASAPQVVRYDDNEETPDEVFAQISSAAASRRVPKATPAPVVSPELAPLAAHNFATATHADAIAHSAPVAPSAGMAAQLSASPFAPALRHVLPLTASQTFDVRALFGAGLSTAYLAGLLAPTSHEVHSTMGQSGAPAWSRSFQLLGEAPMAFADVGAPTERAAAEIDYAYVAPELPADATPEMVAAAQEQVAVAQAQQAQQTAIAQVAAQLVASRATSPTEIAQIAQQVGVSASELSAAVARVGTSAAQAQTQAIAPTTTMRTALLSWDAPSTAHLETGVAPTSAVAQQQHMAPAFAPMTAGQAMMDALSMPMLGESPMESTAWTGPGMVAERARAYSVAQERSSADLSFDFVAPELVLAARVYGLGPAEAAQAARLAVAGPGHLTAMAGAVDRTFVQAMAIEAERRQQQHQQQIAQQIQTAYPTSAGEIAAAVSPAQRPSAGVQNAPLDSYSPAAMGTQTQTHASFGVERRVPRGAFLWPSATVGALGLNAAAPDGEQSMSVAALELLAAQAVAELGTYAALAERTPSDRAPVAAGASGDAQLVDGAEAPSEQVVAQARAQRRRELVAQQLANAPSIEAGTAALYQRGDASSESDVLSAAAAMVPMARRARFDALYLALSQSANSKTWSPAARAARAFALAGHGSDDSAALSAAERAATAWDVLPVVYATSVDTEMARERASAAATRTNKPLPLISSGGRRGASRRGGADAELEHIRVDSRPGLANLSARAGEALGSYVEPTIVNPAPTPSSSSSSSSSGAVLRAPTAAQELVRTGRPAGRHGGGETEIPSWFEAAARKMLEDRSSVSDGISLAELTLIQTMPAAQVAASKDDGPSAGSAAPAAATTNLDTPHKVDVEKVAQEVYQFIMQMLDHARARNGEPYL